MAANVGDIACDYLNGAIRGNAPSLDIWKVPGQVGYGVHIVAVSDGAFDLIAVKIGTLAEVRAWAKAIEALKGSVISIELSQNEDNEGQHDHLVIAETTLRQIIPLIFPGEPTKTHRGELQLVGICLREHETA